MICQKCGMHDRVTRTITKGGKVTRIRRCIKCGDMVKTVEEQVSPDPEPPKPEPKPAPPAPKKKRRQSKPKGALAQALGESDPGGVQGELSV